MGNARDLGHHDLRSLEQRGQLVFPRDPTPSTEPAEPTAPVDRATQIAIASGSSFELFAGVIAAVLAVIGIAGYSPRYMAATAVIAVGFALLAQGGTMAARWQNAVHIAGSEKAEAVGIGTEVFGGLAGIVLGVLALLDVAADTLLPVAALVVGAAMLLGGPAQPQIAEVAPAASARRWHVTRDAVRTSSGVMVMAGVAALVLGILAVAANGPVVLLSLIAMLCVASALVLAGGALTARFARRFA